MTGADSNTLRAQLQACKPGDDGWADFEKAALATLTYLFVPPLQPPQPQPRTYSGVERRDAVFPNRVRDSSTNWGLLHNDHGARMILVEFKNYDKMEIGHEEVIQTSAYIRNPWGRLSMIVCSKTPNDSAHRRRNTVYSENELVILFITKADLLEMLDMRDRGEEASNFIIDKVEAFLLQHE